MSDARRPRSSSCAVVLRVIPLGWVDATDGILVFRPDATKPITDITQTFSEFFGGKSYANGFAALQSLVTTDPTTGQPYTTFSADTAALDPTTGVSYWQEVLVWRDANQDGVAQNSEMVSLSSLGITSINLAGSANTGEEIDGSYVTSRATYTRADGTTGQAASVELQTNTTGDVTVNAQGGYVITSTPEGGASASNTFVADPKATPRRQRSTRRLMDPPIFGSRSTCVKRVREFLRSFAA